MAVRGRRPWTLQAVEAAGCDVSSVSSTCGLELDTGIRRVWECGADSVAAARASVAGKALRTAAIEVGWSFLLYSHGSQAKLQGKEEVDSQGLASIFGVAKKGTVRLDVFLS